MTVAIKSEPVPLKADPDGTLRVSGTRVLLDTVVHEFNAGASPEEIVLAFDTLRLEDVYLTLGYYLRHKVELDAYLAERDQDGKTNQGKAEARLSWPKLRARLMARQQGSTHSSPRH